MLSLIPEYIPIDVLLGLGIGTISGVLAAIFLSLKVNKNPMGFVVVIAYIAAFFVFYLLGIFPLTVVVTTIATTIGIWVCGSVFFGRAKTTDMITELEERIVETVSNEGRQSVLEELGIIQPVS